MSRTPSYEYEVLHQFEAIFRDGEHKTQAATRDYQRVWENVINNPPEDGVTPVVVYRMNGRTCAAIAGMDDLVDNEECAMEIARLAARVAELEAREKKLRACVEAADAMRVEARCEHENGNDPREKCCDACCTMIDYDAARAEVDNG